MSISETASVAPDVATSKRAIQRNWFAGKEDHDEVVAKNSPTFRATAEGSALGDKPFVKVLGQVAGEIFKVDEREGQLRDGTPTKSVIAIGEFEAANYKSGEVIESYTAYLPKYYLETCKLALEAGAKSVPFAIEIVLTPTGKSIPTAANQGAQASSESNRPERSKSWGRAGNRPPL